MTTSSGLFDTSPAAAADFGDMAESGPTSAGEGSEWTLLHSVRMRKAGRVKLLVGDAKERAWNPLNMHANAPAAAVEVRGPSEETRQIAAGLGAMSRRRVIGDGASTQVPVNAGATLSYPPAETPDPVERDLHGHPDDGYVGADAVDAPHLEASSRDAGLEEPAAVSHGADGLTADASEWLREPHDHDDRRTDDVAVSGVVTRHAQEQPEWTAPPDGSSLPHELDQVEPAQAGDPDALAAQTPLPQPEATQELLPVSAGQRPAAPEEFSKVDRGGTPWRDRSVMSWDLQDALSPEPTQAGRAANVLPAAPRHHVDAGAPTGHQHETLRQQEPANVSEAERASVEAVFGRSDAVVTTSVAPIRVISPFADAEPHASDDIANMFKRLRRSSQAQSQPKAITTSDARRPGFKSRLGMR